MQLKSIINWELHQAVLEKKGKRKIEKEFLFKDNKNETLRSKMKQLLAFDGEDEVFMVKEELKASAKAKPSELVELFQCTAVYLDVIKELKKDLGSADGRVSELFLKAKLFTELNCVWHTGQEGISAFVDHQGLLIRNGDFGAQNFATQSRLSINQGDFNSWKLHGFPSSSQTSDAAADDEQLAHISARSNSSEASAAITAESALTTSVRAKAKPS